MGFLLLHFVERWVFLVAHTEVALNTCRGRSCFANRVPSCSLKFGFKRPTVDQLPVEPHVFKRRAVARLTCRADLTVLLAVAREGASRPRIGTWMTP